MQKMKFFSNEKYFEEFNEKEAIITLQKEKFIALFENGVSLCLPLSMLKFFKPVMLNEENLNTSVPVLSFEEENNTDSNIDSSKFIKSTKKYKKEEKKEETENETVENIGDIIVG